MQHLKLTFEDIMQSKILYYDNVEESACHRICNKLKIDNMPSIEGKKFYELKDGRFQSEIILENHQLFIHQSLFNQNLLDKFQANKHNILFAFEGEVIQGIVHISDYNNDIVLQAIQDDILSFERKLRYWIQLNGKENSDMLDFFNHRIKELRDSVSSAGSTKSKEDKIKFYEGKLAGYQRRKAELDSLGPFQIFDFSELLEFVSSSFSGKIYTFDSNEINGKNTGNAEILRNLRNLAMHGKNPVNLNQESSIYSLESLKNLFNSLEVLKSEYYKLIFKIRNNEHYTKSIEWDNRYKLKIINDHYPEALKYFLLRN